ncbi:MAG: Unknown protein [uncultured Thiotrichaceae bacterium]|uniref:DUF2069 domain-containing protein n=1 Tax=uncultured Thiotrichaceae bacterium TaxID=298394 RepID=A0A6S6TUG1_9GAMM|nr:MAG: Unknown protein [uncultured Thiotrichaceae bacterium]
MSVKYLKLWHTSSIVGLLGLIALIILWNGWLAPQQTSPKSLEIALFTAPLLFFVRGVLHGRYQTLVLVMFIALTYALLGTWYAFTPNEGLYGTLMIILSILLYTGAYCYTRTIMIRDKQAEAEKTKPHK